MKYKIYRRKKKTTGKVKYSNELPFSFNPSYHKNENIIDISKLSIDEISKKDFFLKQKLQNSIEKEYIELKELAYGLDKFNLKDFFVTSLPFDKKI